MKKVTCQQSGKVDLTGEVLGIMESWESKPTPLMGINHHHPLMIPYFLGVCAGSIGSESLDFP